MRHDVRKPEVFQVRLKMDSEWATKVTAEGETSYQHAFNVMIFIIDASRATTPFEKKDGIGSCSESQATNIYAAVNRRWHGRVERLMRCILGHDAVRGGGVNIE